ncbi:MAG: hypothetical protein MJE68_27920 [Proteobacteria bacterium]|nr:hypothetical protein [Pseudomonadota bacterium]
MTMDCKLGSNHFLSIVIVGASHLHTRAFLEVGGGPLQVLTSLLAMATLVLTSGALGTVFSQFFTLYFYNLAIIILAFIRTGDKGEITAS